MKIGKVRHKKSIIVAAAFVVRIIFWFFITNTEAAKSLDEWGFILDLAELMLGVPLAMAFGRIWLEQILYMTLWILSLFAAHTLILWGLLIGMAR